jgi:hypothetical protein
MLLSIALSAGKKGGLANRVKQLLLIHVALNAFVIYLSSEDATLAALGGQAEILADLTKAGGAIFNGLADLSISYRFAKTDIHNRLRILGKLCEAGKDINVNENRCQYHLMISAVVF